jgi:hypothetical protein
MDELFALGLEIQTLGGEAAKKTLRDIDEAGKGVAGRFNALTKPLGAFKGLLASVGIGFTAAAVTGFFAKAISEATDAQSALERYKQSLENAGSGYDEFSEKQERATKDLQKFTRFSDDEGTAALAEMTTISKNAAGSIENLGLAADIAAAKQISLESAATLVGRVMAGNTSMLARYGIVVGENQDAMEELRKTFGGFAARDGATFQGRLEQIRNASLDVLEAIGNVIIGGDELTGTALGLTEQLGKLSDYIDDNADRWRSWARTLFSPSGGPLEFLNTVSEKLNSIGLQLNTILFDKIPEAARSAAGMASTGGGGGGGRDTPTGPITLAPAVVMARKPGGNRPPPPKKGTKEKEVGIPSPDIDFDSVSQARIDEIGQGPISMRMEGVDMNGIPAPGIGMSVDQLDDMFKAHGDAVREGAENWRRLQEEEAQKSADAMMSIQQTITGGMAATLGDSIYNAFSAAFSGEGIGGFIKAFGQTVLAGVGGIFTQLGMVYLEYGGIMQALSALLPNPFTAGPAGLAIGAALIAMGAALGAVAKGKSSSGHSASGLGGNRYGAGTESMTRLKFVDRPNVNTRGLEPRQTNNIFIIGENDPRAQMTLRRMVDKGGRRTAA